MTEDQDFDGKVPLVVNGRELNATEREALAEAQRRRRAREDGAEAREIGGADRETNPTRYGDWEKSGRAIDFS